jgi:tRNA-2-methylthio-N6-dimethylallyladenosine synthase
MKNKSFYIVCIGCQMNKSDSERIATYLKQLEYIEAGSSLEADLVVFVTCGIRQSAEDRIYGMIPKLKKKKPDIKIIVSGCLSDRQDVQKRLLGKVDLWLNIKDLLDLENLLLGRSKSKTHADNDYLRISPAYVSKISAFVPIGNGCDNYCSYCVVPYARGRESYRSADEIISEIKNLIASGYKEIIMIAQNVNSYRDPVANIDFSDLLRAVDAIPGDYWLRFATSHPKDLSERLIDTMATATHLCPQLHLPVQAGDNEVLKRMNRKYSREHYLGLITKLRQKMPDIALSTDIIVGYPGETAEQFENTKRLMEEVAYDMAYIAQYSPRPGTVSSLEKDDVESSEKKRREETLMSVLRDSASAISRNFKTKKVTVLVENKNRRGEYGGKTRSGKSVRILGVDADADINGTFQNIIIEDVQDFGLSGRLE